MIEKIPIGKEVYFKISKKSPIMKGVIIEDSGLNRIWIKATKTRNGQSLKEEQKNVIATSRNYIYF